MSGREWLVPITPGELQQLIERSGHERQVLTTIGHPVRLVVQGERDRWALEELARMRGVDVRSLTL